MMYRIFLILILFSLILMPSNGETITTITPYNHNVYRGQYHNPRYNQNFHTSTISQKSLSALEKYALKKNYSRESDIKRLERLEELAFGSIQDGSLYNRYQNVENAILTRPQNYYNQSVLNKIGNYFLGQTTGFTPNIIQNFSGYTHNTPSYNRHNFNQYSNGIFNNGFNFFDNSYGSRTGARIID